MAGKDDKEEDKGKKDEEKSGEEKDSDKEVEEERASVKILDAKYVLYPTRTFFDMTSGEKDAIVDFKKLDSKIRKLWAKDFAEDLSISANDKFSTVSVKAKLEKKEKMYSLSFRPDLKKWIEDNSKSKPKDLDALFENEGWKKLGAKIKEQLDAFSARLQDIDKLIESAEMMAVNENDYEKVKGFLNDAMFVKALISFKH